MDSKEITEGNRLIAEFMGFKKKQGALMHFSVPKGEDLKYKAFTLDLKNMPYHSSWDWLQPIIENISALRAPETGEGITVLDISFLTSNEWRCHINYRTKYKGIASTHKSINIIKPEMIKAVWIAVVQFITWFNQNKTQQ